MEAGIIAAVVGGGVSLLVSLIANAVARDRLRREFAVEDSIEKAIQALLGLGGYEMRTFDKIKHHLRGFDDDELRRHLVRAGAVSFKRRGDGEELWGMRDRHQGDLFK